MVIATIAKLDCPTWGVGLGGGKTAGIGAGTGDITQLLVSVEEVKLGQCASHFTDGFEDLRRTRSICARSHSDRR